MIPFSFSTVAVGIFSQCCMVRVVLTKKLQRFPGTLPQQRHRTLLLSTFFPSLQLWGLLLRAPKAARREQAVGSQPTWILGLAMLLKPG
jgi:hypothetical protein